MMEWAPTGKSLSRLRSLPNDGEEHLRELRIMPFLPNNDLAILETPPGGKAASSSLE
jgi:hypothetical protein